MTHAWLVLLVMVMVGCTTKPAPSAPQSPLLSVAITPATPTQKIGMSIRFTAVASYADDTIVDVTAYSRWRSSNTSVAVIVGNPPSPFPLGLNEIACASRGYTTISAEFGEDWKSSTALTCK